VEGVRLAHTGLTVTVASLPSEAFGHVGRQLWHARHDGLGALGDWIVATERCAASLPGGIEATRV
jgi:hypothetical protein